MIAQAVVEYGLIQSISASFMNAFHHVELFLSSGNARYFVLLGLAFLVGLIWASRRANLRL